jgi:glycosyltransferase involved in cell wall biosynthesis
MSANPVAQMEQNQAFFSIIMNVYNGEAYLKQAIDSVLAQTFFGWELIIWDDVSSDGSAALCLQYAATDPRIHYYLSPRHTQIGQARNLAIAKANGQWLAFLDQDDIWEAHKLAGQYQLIQSYTGDSPLGLVYGRTIQFNSQGRLQDFDRWHKVGRLPNGDIFSQLLAKPCFVCLSSSVLLKTAVVALGGIPSSVNHCPDYYLFVQVAKNYQATCLQTACCWYRQHPANMSSTHKIPIYAETLAIINQQADNLDAVVLQRRRQVYHSLIGLQEIRGGIVSQGLQRIVTQGSLLYVALLPWWWGIGYLRRRCQATSLTLLSTLHNSLTKT